MAAALPRRRRRLIFSFINSPRFINWLLCVDQLGLRSVGQVSSHRTLERSTGRPIIALCLDITAFGVNFLPSRTKEFKGADNHGVVLKLHLVPDLFANRNESGLIEVRDIAIRD